MTIVVSPRAREDLAQAYRRIAEDNPEADRTYYRKTAGVFQIVRVYHQARPGAPLDRTLEPFVGIEEGHPQLDEEEREAQRQQQARDGGSHWLYANR